MFRLHEGRDYFYYKIYIWGGLIFIVLYTLLVAMSGISNESNRVMIILNIPITLWFLGILAYWWWVFLFKDREELIRSLEDPSEINKGLRSLKNWTALFTSMCISGGDKEDILEYEKDSRRPVIIWYGLQNLLALWVLGNFWIWALFQDKLPANYIRSIWVPGVLVIIGLLIVSPLILFRMQKCKDHMYLIPLGLSVSGSSENNLYQTEFMDNQQKLLSDEAKVFIGKRKGRKIYIETWRKQCFTYVEGRTSSFHIQSRSGKLDSDENSHPNIRDFIKHLPKAKRWRGIEITGNENGIQIKRNSRGLNMWLYDLWLIEQLFKILT